MKKTLLLSALAVMLAVPAINAATVDLWVNDATDVHYGMLSDQTYATLEGASSTNNLHSFKIGGYSFTTASSEDGKKGQDAKTVRIEKGNYGWAVTFRPNVAEQSVTITPPASTYMSGVTFVLSPVNNACPTEASYTITDANGVALDGKFTLSGDNNERVTWVGANKSGYKSLRLQYNKTGMAMRTVEYIIETVDAGSASFADLFTLTVPAGAPVKAGVATPRAENSFGNLGCSFKVAAEVNADCGEKVTLVYNKEVIKSWAADSEEIAVDENTNTIYFDGVTALDVINPGQYTLTIPRGFFKQGDIYSNGVVVNYNAAPNVKYSHMARIIEPTAQSAEFNMVKIVNVNLTTEPVITDSFYVFANRKEYYKKDAQVIDGAVVVMLENPTSDYATYYIDVAEGSIAWPLDDGTYSYSQDISLFQVDISGPGLTIDADAPYGTNDINVSWTTPNGSYTEGYVRYNDQSLALTADELAPGYHTATVAVEKGAWYNVSVVLYPGGIESNKVLVWAGDAINIHNPVNFNPSDCERKGTWTYVGCCHFEEGQSYDLHITARNNDKSTYEYALCLGYDLDNLVDYGMFNGNINEESNTITLKAMNLVEMTNVEAGTYDAEEDALVIQSGDLIVALRAEDNSSTLADFYIGRDATGVEGVEAVSGNAEYFNLQGMKVTNPAKGIYIKKQNDKTTKVVIR